MNCVQGLPSVVDALLVSAAVESNPLPGSSFPPRGSCRTTELLVRGPLSRRPNLQLPHPEYNPTYEDASNVGTGKDVLATSLDSMNGPRCI